MNVLKLTACALLMLAVTGSITGIAHAGPVVTLKATYNPPPGTPPADCFCILANGDGDSSNDGSFGSHILNDYQLTPFNSSNHIDGAVIGLQTIEGLSFSEREAICWNFASDPVAPGEEFSVDIGIPNLMVDNNNMPLNDGFEDEGVFTVLPRPFPFANFANVASGPVIVSLGTPIPEPSTLALVLCSVLGFSARRRGGNTMSSRDRGLTR